MYIMYIYIYYVLHFQTYKDDDPNWLEFSREGYRGTFLANAEGIELLQLMV